MTLPARPELLDLLARQGELLLRQRHAVRLDAVMARGVADQRAPAAADVEEAIARLQPQLPADHVELVALGACRDRRVQSVK